MTKRYSFIFLYGCISILVSACALGSFSGLHSFAYITNQGDNTVSVIHLQQQRLIHSIPVGHAPVGVAVGRAYVYISNTESHDISVISRKTNQVVRRIPLNGTPFSLLLSPHETYLFVSDWFGKKLWKISLNTHPLSIQDLFVGETPSGLAIDADGKILYIANRDENMVTFVAVESKQILKRVAVGKHPFGLAISHNHKWLASANVYDNSVSIIHLPSATVRHFKVGEHPYCLVFSEDDTQIYVTNTQDDTVSVLDVASGSTTAQIAVGNTPEGIDIDGTHLYVANWGSNAISVIDTQTQRQIAVIKVGEKSRALGRFITPRH